MRTSKEIIELLRKCMFNVAGLECVELCWDADIRFWARGVDSLLDKMHDLSLAYVVGDMATFIPYKRLPRLRIYLQPSTDGQTNIDVEFMEELAKINLKSDNAKDETFRRTYEPCS